MTCPPLPERLVGVPNPSALALAVHALLARRDPLAGFSLPDGPLVLARASEEELEDAADGLRALAPLFGPLGEPAFFGEEAAGRVAALERLHAGARVVLAASAALGAACPTPEEHALRRLPLRAGERAPRALVLERLAALGYRKADFVEAPGEYAARGAVVDFQPLEPGAPARVLYDEDRIVSVRAFDPQTQGAGETLPEAAITPVREEPASRTLGEALAERGLWLAEEGLELPAGARALRVCAGASAAAGAADLGAAERFRRGAGVPEAARYAREAAARGRKVLFYAINRGEDERLQEALEAEGGLPGAQFLVGPLRQGFECAPLGLALLPTADIFGRSYRPPRAWRPWAAGRARLRWGELKKGDFVLHEQYGVARYLGLETVETRPDPESVTEAPVREDGRRGGRPRRLGSEDPGRSAGRGAAADCLRLEFRGGDALFVPVSEFGCVRRYAAAEGSRPRLSSLDTRSWEAVRERVREGVRELAEQLLRVHARRKALPGHAFAPDTRMEREFAESFPFEETPDQRRAIEEVKADLEAPHPMDRVVIGDVGYGKTEVALRAALKCAAGGKQAAVLAPTTVLADQHLRSFRDRFAGYPVRVVLLSRFSTPKERKEALAAAASGAADIVIGTHRLLQRDVRFKDLGLLVIDEEHRFGVGDKERIKALRERVDALSLSATPIPRTLHQCLSGLRQVSLIQSAPTGRKPIQTAVLPYDEAHAASAVRDELARGGQVYYVHNRVRSLPEAAARLKALVPEARVVTAHGQMPAERIEKAMWDFFRRKADVLVASSIIESGLDIPTVNTLLVEDAQDFGLSQLYQLRGRIGRERRKAYCYLYYPAALKDYRALSEEARKRLEAMRDFADLGSGFSLALRDLEIRGAGDLLGPKQHGFLNAVGAEFYAELLAEEIARVRGERPAAPAAEPPAHLDLSLRAFLPKDYLPGDLERIQFYKRMLAAGDGELDALRRELEDLSGPAPAEVDALFRVLRIRLKATRAKARTVVQRGGRVEVYLRPQAEVPAEAVTRWASVYKDRLEFVRSAEGDGVRVWVTDRDPVDWIEDFLEGLASRR